MATSFWRAAVISPYGGFLNPPIHKLFNLANANKGKDSESPHKWEPKASEELVFDARLNDCVDDICGHLGHFNNVSGGCLANCVSVNPVSVAERGARQLNLFQSLGLNCSDSYQLVCK